MKKLLLLSILFFIISCANIKDTVVPDAGEALKNGLSGEVIYSQGCTHDNAYLKVSHYQGIFRVPQPSFIAGFPQEQRDEMLEASLQTAAYSFFQELSEIGADIRLLTGDTQIQEGSSVIKCNISRIRIGIYDNGFGGFGSAGDFWEAEIDFKLTLNKGGREYDLPLVTGRGEIKHAPISAGSFFDIIILSAKIATAAVNGSMFGVMNQGLVNYKVDKNAKSPVIPAAKLAAIETAKLIVSLK